MPSEEQHLHPADVADQLERLPIEEAQEQLRQMSHEEAAAVLAEVDEEARPELLHGLSAPELAHVIDEMANDDAADVIAELSPEHAKDVVEELSPEAKSRVTALLHYPPDTAGGIMSDQFIALRSDETVEDVLLTLRAQKDESPAISYLYVTNARRQLIGIISLRDLVFSPPFRRLAEIMNPDVKQVLVTDDQEKIARLFEHYHYMALPVVDEHRHLHGIVSSQQVMDVLREEATEDMQLMVGLSGEERVLTPWQRSLRNRLPWLCVNLATAFLAGAVIAIFESTIAKWAALAVFLPIIAGQGGNAGMQTLTVIIREMALGDMAPGDGWKALFKELLLGILNGLAIGIIVGVVGYMWKGNIVLGVIVGVAMLLNMVAAALSGVLVPYTLKWCKVDPALASSIFVTTVTDVGGFLFFLGLATLALKWFPL
ncbi:MAG: magnesium transporter [Verrucomicrobia bacterium]|nr:magnesium transporter [Verrucomicrobiota bacterium]